MPQTMGSLSKVMHYVTCASPSPPPQEYKVLLFESRQYAYSYFLHVSAYA